MHFPWIFLTILLCTKVFTSHTNTTVCIHKCAITYQKHACSHFKSDVWRKYKGNTKGKKKTKKKNYKAHIVLWMCKKCLLQNMVFSLHTYTVTEISKGSSVGIKLSKFCHPGWYYNKKVQNIRNRAYQIFFNCNTFEHLNLWTALLWLHITSYVILQLKYLSQFRNNDTVKLCGVYLFIYLFCICN